VLNNNILHSLELDYISQTSKMKIGVIGVITKSSALIKLTLNNCNFCMLMSADHSDQYFNNLYENYSIELLLNHLKDN
jgi:hypothetical protein